MRGSELRGRGVDLVCGSGQGRVAEAPIWPGQIRHRVIGNGMTVCVLENRAAPVVTSALFYRVGTRDEVEGQGGIAHFLEHMMFKGSEGFGPGEIDQTTQALGGANNAFTSHDLTGYYFDFAPDRWTRAVEIEADRMRGLRLDPDEVDHERQVILEEIAMSESDPWDALEMAVTAAFYRPHPYGNPVLGTREQLAGIGADELAAFHRRFYGPENAVLVIGGDIGEEALAVAEDLLGGIEGGKGLIRMPPPGREPRGGLERLVRHRGEVARVLLALPAPPATHPDHAVLQVLIAVLGDGRASRLQRALVDDGQLASWISVDTGEMLESGHVTIAAELVPGVEPRHFEARLLDLLGELCCDGVSAAEVERAKTVVLADWVFQHERVHQQTLTLGNALTLFDLRQPERELTAIRRADADDLGRVARRYLDPAKDGVLGWSLPAGDGEVAS